MNIRGQHFQRAYGGGAPAWEDPSRLAYEDRWALLLFPYPPDADPFPAGPPEPQERGQEQEDADSAEVAQIRHGVADLTAPPGPDPLGLVESSPRHGPPALAGAAPQGRPAGATGPP